MRFFEIENKFIIPITNEEAELMARFSVGDTIDKKDLSEREQVIANNLVNKEILLRRKINEKILYKQNKRSKVVRDSKNDNDK